MNKPETINSTVYDTENVEAIVLPLLEKSHYHPSILKIRYLNKPRGRGWGSNTKQAPVYVHYEWSNKQFVVALLRPAKLKAGALQWLAEQADAEEVKAPQNLAVELVEAMVDTFGRQLESDKFSALVNKLKKLPIHIHEKAQDRSSYTKRQIEEQLESATGRLDRLTTRLEWAQWCVKDSEASIPAAEKRIKELKKKLEKYQ